MEEIELILDEARSKMDKSINHLRKELVKIRTGVPNPSMLDNVKVKYYGSITPIAQVANINTLNARTLSVQPWEKELIPEIEKAILNSNLGLNPQNNGEMVMINIPPLTEERRKNLVKRAEAEAEEARIGIRNSRKEINDRVKKLDGISKDIIKDAEAEIQKITDIYIKKVEAILEVKEEEIMQV